MVDLSSPITPPANLAVAYAQPRFRFAFALLLQIDARFAEILRNARDPMIAQIKMAWWREAIGKTPDARPKGEPLLQALSDAGDIIPLTALEALASAWEVLLGRDHWPQEELQSHAALRAEAIFQTYATWIGSTQDVHASGQLWAINALRLAFPERVPESAASLQAALPKGRKLRPLSILTMSMRTVSGPRLVLHALTGM